MSDEGGGRGPVGKTVPGAPDPDALATPAPRPADVAAAKRGDADVLPRGTMVDGKYAVDRVLGAGGMGVVYLARDVHTGIEVVLKAIRPHLAHRNDIRERVITEGRALAQIDHPNVVHLKAVVAAANGLFLVMPFIDGESLDKTLKRATARGEKIAVTEALRLFRMILAGVGAAHGEGVIHRDLKPANVLLRKKDGVAKVTDFGIAKGEEQARAGQGQTKGVIGSLWYMSPEQVQGKRDLDKRVDIYSLGVVLFELLTGHVPFQGESSYDIMKAHVDQPMPKVRSERSDVPAWIDELLAKACAKSRDDRFPSCEAFLEALDAAQHAHAAQLAAPAAPVAPTSKAPAAPATEPAHEIGASTGPATSLTGERGARSRATGAPPKPSRAPTIALLGFGLIGGGLALALFLTSAGTQQRPHLRETSPWASTSGPAPGGAGNPIATSSAKSPVSSASSATGPAAPPEVTLASLQGAWISEAGRQFDAVLNGDDLEFRIVEAKQFEPQDYRTGEARFVLLEGDGDSSFAVEDKVRPIPPTRSSFDSAKARTTCQENWRDVAGRPLRATFDGQRLTVEAAKIEPGQANFTRAPDQKIIGCVGLGRLPASVVKTTLSRK